MLKDGFDQVIRFQQAARSGIGSSLAIEVDTDKAADGLVAVDYILYPFARKPNALRRGTNAQHQFQINRQVTAPPVARAARGNRLRQRRLWDKHFHCRQKTITLRKTHLRLFFPQQLLQLKSLRFTDTLRQKWRAWPLSAPKINQWALSLFSSPA